VLYGRDIAHRWCQFLRKCVAGWRCDARQPTFRGKSPAV
jgi:hypothetical protein